MQKVGLKQRLCMCSHAGGSWVLWQKGINLLVSVRFSFWSNIPLLLLVFEVRLGAQGLRNPQCSNCELKKEHFGNSRGELKRR